MIKKQLSGWCLCYVFTGHTRGRGAVDHAEAILRSPDQPAMKLDMRLGFALLGLGFEHIWAGSPYAERVAMCCCCSIWTRTATSNHPYTARNNGATLLTRLHPFLSQKDQAIESHSFEPSVSQ